LFEPFYGLKSSGAAWRTHFANTLHELGFPSCLANHNVWLRPATKPDGFKYYDYILVFIEDLLVHSNQPILIMKGLEEYCGFKDGYEKPT
jgi:hypothetical protein